jgi:hypothetical protein
MVRYADGEVIGIAHNDHFASGHTVAPTRSLVQAELAPRVIPLRCGTWSLWRRGKHAAISIYESASSADVLPDLQLQSRIFSQQIF